MAERGEAEGNAAAIARTVALGAMQQLAAHHLARSLRESVPVTIMGEADVEALAELRESLNAARPQGSRRITWNHLIVKAVAQALVAHPGLNATLVGREVRHYADVNIGVALALPDGNLIVPVIRNADRKSLAEVGAEAEDLGERARAGKLGLKDVQGGTFTVSNGGMIASVRWTTPVINGAQAAILGLGAIRQAAVVRDGALAVRRVLPTSLTFDHRFVNGIPASRFIETLHDLLAAPDQIDLGQ